LSVSDVKVILLIENPEALFTLQEILTKTKLNVIGIGFGSQDYCNETGMKHTAELLKYPRFMISGIAKACRKTSIDIACMDIKNDEIFLSEIEEAESMGFDAKFIIHPRQLQLIRNYKFYSDNEIFDAAMILAEYERLGKPPVFVFKGRAVEPPHINNYKKIINWEKIYGSQ
jgi:citrate lyase beta subunit